MQLNLTFSGEEIILPFAHKYAVQGLLYRMLLADKAYAMHLHDEGIKANGKRFKRFTFGNLLGTYEIRSNHMCFPHGFTLKVRSCDQRFINAVRQSATENKVFSLCGNPIVCTDCQLEERKITETEIRIKTLSPITVYTTSEQKKTHYYTPFEPAFYRGIETNARHKFVGEFGCLPIRPFSITPIQTISEKNKTVTTYKNTYITAWSGQFRLASDSKMLDLLYHTGLGAKNAQGFGMFELIDT